MFSSHRFDLQYVQVVNSPGTYGEEAAEELVKHARQSGICVAQTIALPSRDLTRESADRVVQVNTIDCKNGIVQPFLTTAFILIKLNMKD